MASLNMGPVTRSAAYVERAAPLCQNGGCQLHTAQRTLDQARELFESRNNMSVALWCDQGGHAFSERDPGRQRITVNTLDEVSDQEVQVSKDFCGDCAAPNIGPVPPGGRSLCKSLRRAST